MAQAVRKVFQESVEAGIIPLKKANRPGEVGKRGRIR